MDPKKTDLDENDNIYKNTIDLDDDDTETIEIDDDDTETTPLKETKPEKKEQKPVRRPITPIKPVIKKRPVRVVQPIRKERRPTKQSSSMWPWIVLIVVVIIGAGILIWSVFLHKTPVQPKGTVVATVNGETITLEDVDKRLSALNPVYRQLFTKELILNQSVDELLLVQDAKSKGIVVTDAELTALFDGLLAENNMTYADLSQKLEAQGLSLAYFQDIYRKKLTIDKLLNQSISNVAVTDAEIKAYYDNNTNTFKDPEKVTVKHILISIENRTDADAKTLAQDVLKQYTDGADFCTLVTKYSEDPGSKATCGEYTFSRGQMVPEFEDLSFQLGINKTGIAKTQFGYHIILKTNSIPGRLATLDELSDKIKQSLEYQKQQAAYDAFISELRAKASIQIDFDVLNGKVPAVNPTGNAVQDTNTAQNTQPQPNPVDTKPVDTAPQEETKPVQVQSSITAKDLAICLNENGAVMYGSYWKKDVKTQKELFGDSFSNVAYVECDANGQDADPKTCEKKGITSYPTWIINGKSYVGIKSLDELKTLANC